MKLEQLSEVFNYRAIIIRHGNGTTSVINTSHVVSVRSCVQGEIAVSSWDNSEYNEGDILIVKVGDESVDDYTLCNIKDIALKGKLK